MLAEMVRGYALLFALYFVAVMLMPAKFLFGLTGTALVGLGLYLWPDSVRNGLLALVAGVALLALAARTWHREQLAEQEEARRAVEEAAAQARRRHRPGL
ncbi:MAG TPA: hypothetical protein P5572_01610 [Phycisphaerae bacterium]|nr:hypothetical protein [Phycisphaerae bacterium]